MPVFGPPYVYCVIKLFSFWNNKLHFTCIYTGLSHDAALDVFPALCGTAVALECDIGLQCDLSSKKCEHNVEIFLSFLLIISFVYCPADMLLKI